MSVSCDMKPMHHHSGVFHAQKIIYIYTHIYVDPLHTTEKKNFNWICRPSRLGRRIVDLNHAVGPTSECDVIMVTHFSPVTPYGDDCPFLGPKQVPAALLESVWKESTKCHTKWNE